MAYTGVVAAALGSALAAASSSVLQHRSARRAPDEHGTAFRLVAHLLTRRTWLLGIGCALVGLVLHALALAEGRLAVVQPLLVSGLLFALPVSVLLERRRPRLKEWLWSVVVVAGLATFLLAAQPSAGTVSPDTDALFLATMAGLGAIAFGVLLSRVHRLTHRAVPLAAAGGAAYGVTSALIKQVAALAAGDVDVALTTWPLYGVVAVGGIALLLTQAAYKAGPLSSSLPAMTVSDPASSVAIGALAFHERLTSSPLALSLEITAFVVMALGTWQVARHSARGAG